MFFKAWIIQLYDVYFQPNLFCEIDVHGTFLHIDGLIGICACVLSFGQSSTFAFSCRSRGLRTTPCQWGKTTVLEEQVPKLCWTPSPNRYDSCQWKPVALFWQRHCIWWCLVNIRREIIFQERDTHGHQVVWVSETNSGPVHGEAPAFTIKAYVVFPLAERGDKLTTAPWNICLPFLPKFMVNDGKCKDSFPMEQLAYMRQMLMLLFLLRS